MWNWKCNVVSIDTYMLACMFLLLLFLDSGRTGDAAEFDIDCIVLPIHTKELFKFPSLQMASLVNYPVFAKDVKGTCICDFGWCIFAVISKKQKAQICIGLVSQGIRVIAHRSPHILTTGRILVGLHILCRAVIGAGIESVTMCSYGMKIPYSEVELLNTFAVPTKASLARYDIGRNINTSSIPLFCVNPEYSGNVYPMFHHIGAGYGSVLVRLKDEDPRVDSVQLKCYPRVMHFIRASAITDTIPRSIVKMTAKLEKIKYTAKVMRSNLEQLTGFRYEYMFRVRRRLAACHSKALSMQTIDKVPVGIEITRAKTNIPNIRILIRFGIRS